MSKRRVPAALHNELSEYAALLRALRTRDTMDVTKHLVKPSPFAVLPNQVGPSNQVPLVSQEDFEGSVNSVSTAGSSDSREDTPSSAGTQSVKKGQEKAATNSGKAIQVQRDHWTRWPLLLDDVATPEWTLEDEIAAIASGVLKMNPTPFPAFHSNEAESYAEDDFISLNMEIDEDDPDHPHYASFLTYTSANVLSAIFAQLASYIPARAASLQNRTEALNWRGIIDAVVSCNDPEVSNSE
ncbi:hypothetical protein CPB83DRAFT_165158 [Crepidotus variabilis]|uniref:Uncharacterized protein n=1 Tax=Crepidotus variabilis TaxID=179855 RepID=A0A9P6EKI0_9AGAR|nr:hypothetical protein CPB83DRAFT_165158 [Crepidotus variabilis]